MRKEALFTVVAEWLEEGKIPPPLVLRNQHAIEPGNLNRILAVVGPRRAGKTYFMYQLIQFLLQGDRCSKEDILFIDFEDYRLGGFTWPDMDELFTAFHQLAGRYPRFLFFDEVQNLPDWNRVLRTLHNRRRFKIIVSGSNSKLLGREIATELRGRYEDILMLPFSFREYLRYRDISFTPTSIRTAARGSIVAAFDDYIRHGGFPEVVMARNEAERRKLLQNYFKTIFFAIREAPEGQRAARQQTHHRELSPLSPGSIFCHRKREVLFLPPPQDHESEKDLPDRYRFCRAGAPFCGKPGEDT